MKRPGYAPGQMYHVPAASLRGAAGAWFVVTDTDGHAVTFIMPSLKRDAARFPVGTLVHVAQCDYIPDEDVPDEIWATLAKWRLLNG